MITKETIIQIACGRYGITPEQLRSKSRRREITDARKVIAYLLLDYGLCCRMGEVGREIGLCRNSVYKALQCFVPLLTYDHGFRRKFHDITSRIDQAGPGISANR